MVGWRPKNWSCVTMRLGTYLWKTFSVNMVHHDNLIIEGDTWSPGATAETKQQISMYWLINTASFVNTALNPCLFWVIKLGWAMKKVVALRPPQLSLHFRPYTYTYTHTRVSSQLLVCVWQVFFWGQHFYYFWSHPAESNTVSQHSISTALKLLKLQSRRISPSGFDVCVPTALVSSGQTAWITDINQLVI